MSLKSTNETVRCARPLVGAYLAVAVGAAWGAEGEGSNTDPAPEKGAVAERIRFLTEALKAQEPRVYIREFRVVGAKALPKIAVEEAVYPYLGPGRTFKDVEAASAALQKLYQDNGYGIAQVSIPAQSGARGIITLVVTEGKVGELRVKGAKYFLPSRVKAEAPSLAPGKTLNFNDLSREIVRLNRMPDRRVEPKLHPTNEPGIYDIDLLVKDKLPLHGSVELNNRRSTDTTDLRLSGSLSYANLWQAGHTIGVSGQISPQDRSEVKVYTGYYIWRFQELDWLSLMFSGTKQDSNVSTLGGAAVAGRGEILGIRGLITLPSKPGFYQSMSVGLDYKNFDQAVQFGGTDDVTPIRYYPLSVTWDGTWLRPSSVTTLSAALSFGLRGAGSDRADLERNRFGADPNFLLFKGDISHTQQIGKGWELYGRVQGQAADQPLVNNEQYGGGGMSNARGYLEAEALGDNAIFGTVEIRTPSLLRTIKKPAEDGMPEEKTGNEWRFYAFADAGTLTLHDVLPEQDSSFNLASIGIGSEIHLVDHMHGIVELALPLTSLSETKARETRVNFRLWADF